MYKVISQLSFNVVRYQYCLTYLMKVLFKNNFWIKPKWRKVNLYLIYLQSKKIDIVV